MNPNSPHYQFDPNNIGWLHRRQAAGEEIHKDDIIRLLEADPGNANDPLLQDFLLSALTGKLNGKQGRPPMSTQRLLRYQAAISFYEEGLPKFQRELKDGTRVREKYDLEPSKQFAQMVADEFRLGCSGHAFLNTRTVMKKAQQ